jgi:flagellar hook protein FlgE
MGIYGALSTAVTGLRAQSYSLENISGNIANSQTVGFKRIDTDFVDLIPDSDAKLQSSGSVMAQSRATNNIQGDVKGVSSGTNMAINGNGFFVVEPPIGQSDGEAIFAGSNFYTRRGDFDLDKSGYLVNGAGYYLKGLPIDPVTQNISGSVPQVLKISNAFLPAQQTTSVNYELNLPQQPKTASYQASPSPGNELLSATDFLDIPPDAPAKATGAAALGTNATSTIASDGDTLTITVGGASRTYTFTATGGTTMPAIDITDPGSDTVAEVLAQIQTDLQGAGATGATVGLTGGRITVTAGNVADDVTIADGTTGSGVLGFGLADGTSSATVASSTALAARVDGISADQADAFISQSISGGAITVYAGNGAPANVQMRWAKVNSVDNGGADRWNLYVMTNANATGAGEMWTRIGGDYTFGPDGSPTASVEHTDLPALTVNGVLVGDVRLQHGTHGLTQFADPNGTAEVTTLNQNGYAAGQYVSVSVNDNGRAVVSYSNGQQLEVAQVVTANFNAVNQLKRLDGGVFAATSESGEPIFNNGGGIIGSSLEASNTDISEEFTKLIVTQQAYAAGTRIVSTADQMLQDALNMLR